MRATAVLLSVGVAALASVPFAAVAAPSARLVYLRDDDAASCPDEAALRSAVAGRLGYDPFVAYARATMFAEIRRAGGAFKATVKLVDADNVVRGARELVHAGERCEELIDQMALSMSIAIDPLSLGKPAPPPLDSQESPSPPEGDSPPTGTGAPSLDASHARPADASEPAVTDPKPAPAGEEASRPAAPSEAAPVHLDAAAGPALWIGSAPAPAFGILGNAEFRRRSLGALVEFRTDFPASRAVTTGSVRTSLTVGTVAVCVHLDPVFGCLGGSVGELSASGEGMAVGHDVQALHAVAELRGGVAVPISKMVSLRTQGSVGLVLTPHRLAVDQVDAYTLSRVAAGVTEMLVVRFF